MPCEPASGKRHADAVAAALPERAGRRLDARRQVIFRMARAFAAELTKVLDVVERHRGLVEALVFGIDGFDAGQVQQGIEQHRSVAIRQHEAIAIWPNRVVGIEAQKLLPDRVAQRRQRHRRAGVARVGLLDRVHRQGADRIDAPLVDRALRSAIPAAFPRGCGILFGGNSRQRFRRCGQIALQMS